MKNHSKVYKIKILSFLTLLFNFIALEEKTFGSFPYKPLNEPITLSLSQKTIKIADNSEEKKSNNDLEDLKDFNFENDTEKDVLNTPPKPKKSSWKNFFKRLFTSKEKPKEKKEETSPFDINSSLSTPPSSPPSHSPSESSALPSLPIEKKELELESSINNERSSYENLHSTSKKTNLGPIASKAYTRNNGFHLGLTGEILTYSFKKELEEDLLQTPSANENVKRYSKSHTSSGNIAFYLSHRSSLFRIFKRDIVTILNSKFQFSEWGIKKNAQVNSNLKGSSSVEFAYIDFLFNPYFNLRLGNQLLPLGLTNPHQEILSHYSVKVPEIEKVIIPERWHENGVQIWGGNLHSSSFFYRYSLGAFNSLSAMTDNKAPQFNAENFISQGVQNGRLAKTNDIALVGRLDLHFLKESFFGGSIFYGNTSQDYSNERITPRNNQRNPSNNSSYNFKKLDVLIWETHFKIKTKLWFLKALFVQGVIFDAYKLPPLDEQSTLASQAQVLAGRRVDENLATEEEGTSLPEESTLPAQTISPVGRIVQGYYVSLGLNLLRLFSRHSKSQLIFFGRYQEYNLHYAVPFNIQEDRTLLKRRGTIGVLYTPPKENFVFKINYQIARNYYNKERDSIDVSFGFAL